MKLVLLRLLDSAPRSLARPTVYGRICLFSNFMAGEKLMCYLMFPGRKCNLKANQIQAKDLTSESFLGEATPRKQWETDICWLLPFFHVRSLFPILFFKISFFLFSFKPPKSSVSTHRLSTTLFLCFLLVCSDQLFPFPFYYITLQVYYFCLILLSPRIIWLVCITENETACLLIKLLSSIQKHELSTILTQGRGDPKCLDEAKEGNFC